MALLFLFVSCNAAFMGGIAASPETDTTNRVIAIGIFVPLLAWVVALTFGLRRALFGRWLTGRRWRRIDAQLLGLGFREATPFEVDHTSRLPAHILAPAILGPQRGGGIDHVRIGHIEGREVRCFNARVRGGAWADVPVVAVRADGSFAPTVIWRTRFADPPRPGMQKMRFELEAFNRSVSVFSTDRYFANAMIDARMMEWLLAISQGPTIELSDRWVIAWTLGRRKRTMRPVDLLAVLRDFDERIPRVIPSLFPREDGDVLWTGSRGEIHVPEG